MPQATLERDPTCQNLEFNLSVYFAVYPIRTGVRELGVSSKRDLVFLHNCTHPKLAMYIFDMVEPLIQNTLK